MIIEENARSEELIKIFNENNQDYVHDYKCLTDDKYLKLVAVEENKAIGYQTIYFGNDFVEKEGFAVDFEVESDSAYIWNCITKKGYESRGVQSYLMSYLKEKCKGLDIYSIVDVKNVPSKRLHEKAGFEPVKNFTAPFGDKICDFTIVRYKNTN